MTTARDFMSRIVPWPGGTTPGYVNLHYSIDDPRKPGQKIVTGKPFTTLDGFMNFVGWMQQQPSMKDAWFCTSLQSTAGKTSRGKAKAIRGHLNAVGLKAIWIDIDVKPGQYDTLEDALVAFNKFRTDANLPPASALVQSGSGLHVYWISDRLLIPGIWDAYAHGLRALIIKHGLKCDAGLTTDNVRLLRVPTTLNYKTAPPKPVKLLKLLPSDYDFAATQELLALTTLANVPNPSQGALQPAANQFFDPTLFTKPDAAFSALTPEPLMKRDKVNPFPIIKGCKFLRDALLTGGKDYDNPKWNLTTLAAVFMENGDDLAHKMARGHKDYTFDSTEALYQRKVSDQRNKNMGYPKCSTIQASGCTDCASCPFFSHGKSPLNITPEVTATVTGTIESGLAVMAGVNAGLVLPDLPPTYVYDRDGFICKVIEEPAEKGHAPTQKLARLFYCHLTNVWAQGEPDALNFQTTTDKGNVFAASLRITDIVSMDLKKKLVEQKVKPVSENSKYLEGFLMAWLNKLHNAQQSQLALPFGWWTDPARNNDRHGFVFGDVLVKDDGTQGPSGIGDGKLKQYYRPTGSLQPWLDACKMVTDQQRPEFDTIIAASFAAPLMVSGGEYGGIISAWGETGSGKSAALKVGLAVWGHPKKAKEVTRSTTNGVLHKLTEVRNLPLFWDEISNEEAQKAVFNSMFAITDGVAAARLTSNIQQRDRGDWQTLAIMCANLSFVDYVVGRQPTHSAGMARCLEYEVKKAPPGSLGIINSVDASRILQRLEGNYGVMGMAYSKLLGTKPAEIDKIVHNITLTVTRDLKTTQDERYWAVFIGSLLAGARFANLLGATLNYDLLKNFLYKHLLENRKRVVSESVQGGSRENTEEILTNYFKARVQQQLWTNTFLNGPGKPIGINVLHAPPQTGGVRIGLQIHWAVNDRMLRFSRRDFRQWLQREEIPPRPIMNGLETQFGATSAKAIIGAGTQFKNIGQETVIQIPIVANTALEAAMFNYTNPQDIGAQAAINAEAEDKET